MFVSVQRFEIGSLGLSRVVWGVFAPGLWVNVFQAHGFGQNENVVAGLGFGRPIETRSSIGLGLVGRCVVRCRDGRTVECPAGDAALFPGRSSFRSTVEASAEGILSMHIEMDRARFPGPLFTPDFGRLADLPAARAKVDGLTASIERAWSDPDALPQLDDALAALFDLLRANGLPVPPPEAWRGAQAAPKFRQFARAIDQALSQTDTRPMLVDVERLAGVCGRTIERAFPELCAAWGQKEESFRAYTQRANLLRASGAMANARATTEGVARAMGFSSPNAFCRAMARAGLPSPGNIRRAYRVR